MGRRAGPGSLATAPLPVLDRRRSSPGKRREALEANQTNKAVIRNIPLVFPSSPALHPAH